MKYIMNVVLCTYERVVYLSMMCDNIVVPSDQLHSLYELMQKC